MEKRICYNCFKETETEGKCPYCGFEEKDDHPFALKGGRILGGKYIVGRVLGQGGFGITYVAQDYATKQRVAIKEYFPEVLAARTSESTQVLTYTGEKSENFQYGKKCFLEEAKTLAEFMGNPNIVRVYSYFEENGTAYFSMEYVDGMNLTDYVGQNGSKISFDEAKKILLPVMSALSEVHARGIIHRDISPDNIFIQSDDTVKLIDFGAARYSMGDRSRSLDVILKHGYAPKEQYTRRGKQGPFTDVYALAATFYKAITGQVPPDSVERMEEDEIIYPSTLGADIPSYAEDALMKALSVYASERFQTMDEFKNALNGFDTPIDAPVDTEPKTVSDDLPPDNSGKIFSENEPKKNEPSREMGKIKKIVIPVAAALFICVVLLIMVLSSGNKDNIVRTDTSVNEPEQTSVESYSDTSEISEETSAELSTIIVSKIEESVQVTSNENPEDVFEYDIDDGEIVIMGYSGREENLVIPEKIDEKNVGSIDYEAFKGNTALKTVIIPDTVSDINYSAFEDCTNLAKIYFPDREMNIGGNVAKNTAYEKNETNWDGDVLYIGSHVVGSRESSVLSYKVRTGTLSICWNAFHELQKVRKITIPSDVEFIGYSAFANCYDLEEIAVQNTNLYYCSIDGVLYSKNQKRLYCYPQEKTGRSFSVPDGTESIMAYAFYFCYNIETVSIPDSVTYIGKNAFINCVNLSEISLPKDCEIKENSFEDDCKVTYRNGAQSSDGTGTVNGVEVSIIYAAPSLSGDDEGVVEVDSMDRNSKAPFLTIYVFVEGETVSAVRNTSLTYRLTNPDGEQQTGKIELQDADKNEVGLSMTLSNYNGKTEYGSKPGILSFEIFDNSGNLVCSKSIQIT